ncbi:MAG: hypothetical protein R3E12_05270 [Candidatus Eisenbacteria bacterium]
MPGSIGSTSVFLRAYDYYPNRESSGAPLRRAPRAGSRGGFGLESNRRKRLLAGGALLLGESLDGFILHKRGDQIDDVILKLVDAQHPDTMRRVLAGMKKLAESGQWGRFQVALETLLRRSSRRS